MTDKEYQEFDYSDFVDCLRAHSKDSDKLMDMLHCSVGISGEAGELLDHMKKVMWQRHHIDLDYLILELGDILFYLTSMCNCIDVNIDIIRKRNIEKLQARYPDRVFDSERSINRND